MKKILLASVAAIALIATPAYAQISKSDATDDDAIVGGTAGAAAGGMLGFFVGGPIGAIVGGFAGAVLGAEAAVPEQTIVYVGNQSGRPDHGGRYLGSRHDRSGRRYRLSGRTDPGIRLCLRQ